MNRALPVRMKKMGLNQRSKNKNRKKKRKMTTRNTLKKAKLKSFKLKNPLSQNLSERKHHIRSRNSIPSIN